MTRYLWYLTVMLLAAAVSARPLTITDVRITMDEDARIFVDAQVEYELNPTALEALENGVPLTFVTHIQMRSAEAWLWEKDVAELRMRNVLRYRPLSALYEVREEGSDDKQVFATRQAALRALGEVKHLAIIERDRLQAGEEYVIQIEAFLDIEALPLPMRPQAYLSSDWDLNSKTLEWHLTP